MLVACRDLICFGQKVRAGEPIPDPKKWNIIALQSNINIGWIKDVPEEEHYQQPHENVGEEAHISSPAAKRTRGRPKKEHSCGPITLEHQAKAQKIKSDS